jgi:outer membrane protein OmpA-like peptidoglycan-associated protein
MSKWLSMVTVGMFVVAGTTACATKNFVSKRVKVVNDKVETLSQSVEETQERTRRNEGVIGEVDQKAKAAQGTADRAQLAASAAHADARAAGDKAAAVGVKADELDKASKRLVYTVVISEDQGQFKLGKADLPNDAKAMLDELVAKLKADPNGAYFEIEGYTDSLGPQAVNERIGLERAEAVKRYLFEQHQIPLHRMNVISYGMEKPVASNKTRDGRAQNRRVVIRVLA